LHTIKARFLCTILPAALSTETASKTHLYALLKHVRCSSRNFAWVAMRSWCRRTALGRCMLAGSNSPSPKRNLQRVYKHACNEDHSSCKDLHLVRMKKTLGLAQGVRGLSDACQPCRWTLLSQAVCPESEGTRSEGPYACNHSLSALLNELNVAKCRNNVRSSPGHAHRWRISFCTFGTRTAVRMLFTGR
jgi:hypothetical protein